MPPFAIIASASFTQASRKSPGLLLPAVILMPSHAFHYDRHYPTARPPRQGKQRCLEKFRQQPRANGGPATKRLKRLPGDNVRARCRAHAHVGTGLESASHGSRRRCNDIHARRRKFEAQSFRESLDKGFCRRVGGCPRNPLKRQQRTHENQPAAPPGRKPAYKVMRELDDGAAIHVYHLKLGAERAIDERPGCAKTGDGAAGRRQDSPLPTRRRRLHRVARDRQQESLLGLNAFASNPLRAPQAIHGGAQPERGLFLPSPVPRRSPCRFRPTLP